MVAITFHAEVYLYPFPRVDTSSFPFHLHADDNSPCKHGSGVHVNLVTGNITGCFTDNSIRSRCLSSVDDCAGNLAR